MSARDAMAPPPGGGGVWDEIRRRAAELERWEAPAVDLAALWRRRALELAADVDRAADREEALRVVVVRLGPDRYGVRLGSLVEIQKVGRVTRVPGAPAHVTGVINQRGRVLTVLDLRPLLGLPAAEAGPKARILVVEGAGMTVGVLAEEVEEVVEVPAAEVKPALAGGRGAGEDFVTGIVAHRGQMVVLLDCHRLLRAPNLVVEETV